MKAVFITGGTTGIGLSLAKTYVGRGWKVGVCGRDKAKFDENFQALQDNVYFYAVDVSNREALKKAISDFSHSIGLDLLIANAGIGYKFKTKIPDFDYSYKMIHINLLGVMYAFEAALEVMIPRGQGQLVALSSLAGFNGMPGASAYSASKSAVQKYCETLHLDLKQFNIHVTTINPGFIDTPLTKSNHHPMPFLMDVNKASRKIVRAIDRKKMTYAFPFILFMVVRLMSMMPRTWFRFMMTFKMFNYSKEKV